MNAAERQREPTRQQRHDHQQPTSTYTSSPAYSFASSTASAASSPSSSVASSSLLSPTSSSVSFASSPAAFAPAVAHPFVSHVAGAAHTLHVHVPTTTTTAASPAPSQTINMSLRLDFTSSTNANNSTTNTSTSTSTALAGHPLLVPSKSVNVANGALPSKTTPAQVAMAVAVPVSTSLSPSPFASADSSTSSSSAAVVPTPVDTASSFATPSAVVPMARMVSAPRSADGVGSGTPTLAPPPHSLQSHHHSSRKRKVGHSKRSKDVGDSNLETTGGVVANNSSSSGSSGAGGGGGGGGSNSGGARSTSPFEKLNTLKMLLDCGHLTAEEYQERKTQIINELTGTSTTSSKKPSPRRRVLQPIMKTVVPHSPPDFSRLPKERAEKLSFDVDTLEWHAAPVRVKIDLVPFATGQLRNAYFLKETGTSGSGSGGGSGGVGAGGAGSNTGHSHSDGGDGSLLVAKFSIRDAEPSSYLSDVEMQAVCAHYAALYNEHEPPLKVYYARSWLLKLRERGEHVVCSIEEYLPGAYVKYSNNHGFVGKETSSTEERERNTPHAFSHFTFVASDYRLMIVDIQGVNDSYTDPQIHTSDGRGFGAGNLGTFGMEKFLESHRCNEVCRWLGLASINQLYKPGGTAAPPYEMPFGGNIKKSTNRITEERNTFSRSVTVSDTLGAPDSPSSGSGYREHGVGIVDGSDGGVDASPSLRWRQQAMAAGGAGAGERDGSGDRQEEAWPSVASTCATGSSSMLYGQSHPLLPLDPSGERMRPKSLRGGPGKNGEPMVLDGSAGGGPSGGTLPVIWWVLRKLACCCGGW